jgi:UDP-N-acetylglucosamine acyltransferase
MNKNYPLSIISEGAKIEDNVEIEPFVTIQDDVHIGEGSWIGSHVTIMSGTRIGKGCRIFPGAIIGSIPQDLKFEGEYSLLEIGNNVTIREYCTVNRGTRANGKTVIGDNTLIMAYVHIAHDCVIGKNCVLANNVTLAGHIQIGDFSILGGMVAAHQFIKIGDYCMIGGGSLIGKDVPHFVKAARYPLAYAGVNSVGLRRKGFSSDSINHIQDIYRTIYVRGHNTSQALQIIEAEIPASEERDNILSFIRQSKRGIIKSPRLNGSKFKDLPGKVLDNTTEDDY